MVTVLSVQAESVALLWMMGTDAPLYITRLPIREVKTLPLAIMVNSVVVK